MLKKLSCSIIIVLLSVTFLWAVSDLEQMQDYSKAITQIKLSVPDDPDAKAYLGIKQKSGQFMLNDLDGEIIIIEIFSMYCPYCQKHAPTANKLYQAIEEGKGAHGKIKLIGVGVGNSPYEVKFFKKKYGVPFPLFDDANSAVLNSIRGIRTPTYFGIRKNGNTLNVFFTQQGPYDDAQIFLQAVLKKSGIPF
jgi:thiol-disulfide isomerase/thioredoxin